MFTKQEWDLIETALQETRERRIAQGEDQNYSIAGRNRKREDVARYSFLWAKVKSLRTVESNREP